jgi:hypothetical protein
MTAVINDPKVGGPELPPSLPSTPPPSNDDATKSFLLRLVATAVAVFVPVLCIPINYLMWRAAQRRNDPKARSFFWSIWLGVGWTAFALIPIAAVAAGLLFAHNSTSAGSSQPNYEAPGNGGVVAEAPVDTMPQQLALQYCGAGPYGKANCTPTALLDTTMRDRPDEVAVNLMTMHDEAMKTGNLYLLGYVHDTSSFDGLSSQLQLSGPSGVSNHQGEYQSSPQDVQRVDDTTVKVTVYSFSNGMPVASPTTVTLKWMSSELEQKSFYLMQ